VRSTILQQVDAYGEEVLFRLKRIIWIKNKNKKYRFPKTRPHSSDRINRVFRVTRFLSFIRVISVLVVRHNRRPPSPPPTLTPQKLFNFEIVFDFFSAPLSFLHGVRVLNAFLLLFALSHFLRLSLTLAHSHLPPSVRAKGTSEKNKPKKKYDRRSTYKRHDCVDLPQFYHCGRRCSRIIHVVGCRPHTFSRDRRIYM